ncbi:MAG: DUF2815 family protein [Clostridia bacterium]|nr:DUF2815 family protein [Clostridia bacterium]
MYQNIATKVLTGEVRLSYVNLTTPRAAQQGGEPKYSATLLIPKTDQATMANINASIQAAYDDGVTKKWGGAHPQPKIIVHDGDGLRPSGLPFGDECKGCWVLTASTKNKPQVVGIDNINCELAPQDIYSGMYARVTINFFAYDTAGSKGVGCGLGNVLKTRDGEPLSGGASAASDFAEVGASVAPQRPAYAPQYAAPQYAAPQAAPAPQQRPAVNPITGQPW